ncbi:hypothetical protein L1279_002686 [Planomicrobium sp. HSC-17F08]|nr:hypothetical protein [Planomicrobium sp. HSC-17F08]
MKQWELPWILITFLPTDPPYPLNSTDCLQTITKQQKAVWSIHPNCLLNSPFFYSMGIRCP